MSAFFVVVLSGCGGKDGSPGGPGLPAGVDISKADEIVASISSVSVDDVTLIEFRLIDGHGNPVINLQPGNISFLVAKLVPGTDGNVSAWQSYINKIEAPGVGPGTESKLQATTESGSTGELVDNKDGSYQYQFSTHLKNVTEPAEIAFQPTLTHRFSFEIRGFVPVINPVYDVRPSDGATSKLFSREIANIKQCNQCHEKLAFHGGARFEMQQCVMCHNPGTADANSGNTVDMTEMTHKIHHGNNLPSVIAGDDYCIYGFGDTPHCYGDVSHPQDIRQCETCHSDKDESTPQAANWYAAPTVEACGSCHDDVNFETGVNHGSGIVADNSQCSSCHASNPDSRLEVRQAHRILAQEAVERYQLNILSVLFTGVGTAPVVTFSITNPGSNHSSYDLANNTILKSSTLRFYVSWNSEELNNAGNGTNNAQPERTNVYESGVLQASDNGDFTYDLTLTNVATGAEGSGLILFEGKVVETYGDVPITTQQHLFIINSTDAQPTSRRQKVLLDRCNDCHQLTAYHGTRNNNLESCATCHNPDAARGGTPSRGPMDMKHFVHRIHAIDDIRYPQRSSNCKACHTDDGFYPVSQISGVLATSINRGVNQADPTDNNLITPNSATCSVCHASAEAKSHMEGHGGSFDACQETDGSERPVSKKDLAKGEFTPLAN